jgi:Sensors of blue-light using FAD
MIVRCLYASRSTAPLDATIVNSILEQSRKNNPRRGITGLLCYTGDIFVQVLEGGRDQVCDLFNDIVKDERHSNVRILVFEEIAERQFSSWTMGQVDIAKSNQALILRYSEKAELDPFKCSGHAMMALLNELVATGSISNRGQ